MQGRHLHTPVAPMQDQAEGNKIRVREAQVSEPPGPPHAKKKNNKTVGEGGAPQLGQQGGEGEGTTARPSLALPLLSSWGGLGARRPYPGRAVAPGQQGLSLLASVAPLSLRPTQKGQVH